MNYMRSGIIAMQFGTKLNGNGIDGIPSTPAICLNIPMIAFNIYHTRFINTKGNVETSDINDVRSSLSIVFS